MWNVVNDVFHPQFYCCAYAGVKGMRTSEEVTYEIIPELCMAQCEYFITVGYHLILLTLFISCHPHHALSHHPPILLYCWASTTITMRTNSLTLLASADSSHIVPAKCKLKVGARSKSRMFLTGSKFTSVEFEFEQQEALKDIQHFTMSSTKCTGLPQQFANLLMPHALNTILWWIDCSRILQTHRGTVYGKTGKFDKSC